MGFTSGFFGGVTLTTTILYIGVTIHRQNRLRQADLLRQQDSLLRNVVDPQLPAPPPTAREARAGLSELAKDKWNGQVERLVRNVQTTDWNAVRDQWENRITSALSSGLNSVKEKGEEAANQTSKDRVPLVAVKREG